MTANIINIDIDLINSLKAQGKTKEAREMLQAFHDSIKKEKKQLHNELISQDRKIERFIKRKTNYCVALSCNKEALEGKRFCKRHLELNKNHKKQYVLNKRQKERFG